MRHRLPLYLICCFALTLLAGSGCAKKGCTSPTSDNYDPEATVSDGTCVPFTAKFLGEYQVVETCTLGNFSYLMNITPAYTDTTIQIVGMGKYLTPINAEVSGSSLVIPTQSFTEQGVTLTISGTGTISGQILTLNYTYLLNGGQGGACTLTCTFI